MSETTVLVHIPFVCMDHSQQNAGCGPHMISRFLHSSPSSPSGQDPSAALDPSQPSMEAWAGALHAVARRPAARRTACLLEGSLRRLQQQQEHSMSAQQQNGTRRCARGVLATKASIPL